jgi:hypothetical protein
LYIYFVTLNAKVTNTTAVPAGLYILRPAVRPTDLCRDREHRVTRQTGVKGLGFVAWYIYTEHSYDFLHFELVIANS